MAQESLKSMEENGCPPPEGPTLCTQNCGFFGSATNLDLCSQCYKTHILKHTEATATASPTPTPAAGHKDVFAKTESETFTTDRSLRQNSEPTSASLAPSLGEGSSATTGGTSQGGGSSSSATEAGSAEPGKRNSQQGPKRCFLCKKRTGLTGFDCKCGNLFCSTHRYSDEHDCTFDYKSAGRDAIAQANPVVKADKIEKV